MIPSDLLDSFADLIAAKVAARLESARKPVKRLFSTKEAASYIGRSPMALYQMTSRGELPHVVRAGRRVHYAIEDLDRWIAENKV